MSRLGRVLGLDRLAYLIWHRHSQTESSAFCSAEAAASPDVSHSTL
jgi:hypothetical protein